jgi:hypothetical protein
MVILTRMDRKGRLPQTRGMPIHLADLQLPDGRRLADLGMGELANVCTILGIENAHQNGRTKNAELLAAKLNSVGKVGMEKAIADFLRITLEGQ